MPPAIRASISTTSSPKENTASPVTPNLTLPNFAELTDEEFVNAVFEAHEQVNEAQPNYSVLPSCWRGDPAQAQIGTGGDGSQSDLPWGEKKKTEIKR